MHTGCVSRSLAPAGLGIPLQKQRDTSRDSRSVKLIHNSSDRPPAGRKVHLSNEKRKTRKEKGTVWPSTVRARQRSFLGECNGTEYDGGEDFPADCSVSIPIILGNIFQQLYNTTDAIIVGRLIGKDAFAAVSVANPIMSVVLFFSGGADHGRGVLLSQQYGAGQRDKFRVQFSTGLIGGIVFTLAVAAVCIPLSGLMLRAAQTPGEILEPARQYLQIVFGE